MEFLFLYSAKQADSQQESTHSNLNSLKCQFAISLLETPKASDDLMWCKSIKDKVEGG